MAKEDGESRPRSLVDQMKATVDSAMSQMRKKPSDEDYEPGGRMYMMARLLALGPDNAGVRQMVLEERDPEVVQQARLIQQGEKVLREALAVIMDRFHFNMPMVFFLFAQVMTSVVHEDDQMAGSWRRYVLATMRSRQSVNRRLVRTLGYSILDLWRAKLCEGPLEDGMLPPVTDTERKTI